MEIRIALKRPLAPSMTDNRLNTTVVDAQVSDADRRVKRQPRILCISPIFVPEADSEAFCGAKMALALLGRGVDLVVLHLQRDAQDSVTLDHSSIWSELESRSVGIPKAAGRASLRSLGLGLRYRSSCWTRWTNTVVQTVGALHRERPFDCIYSRSLPMWAHIAGYWSARTIHVPWIANINDPWDMHLFPGGKYRVPRQHAICSRYWLRKTLQDADLVTYPSSRLAGYVARLAGFSRESRIIPHVGVLTESGHRRNETGFVLVHAGKLGQSELLTGRYASSLLSGLALFLNSCPDARPHSQLVLVGPEDARTQSEIQDLGLQSVVRHVGRVSYEKSLEWIRAASVCVLVEGNMSEGIYFPSKLADYITCRKPVLAVSPRVGTVADLSPALGILRADPNDSGSVATALGELYGLFRKGALHDRVPSEELAKRFQPKTIADQFLSCILDVLPTHA